jgi:hypothetical protein
MLLLALTAVVELRPDAALDEVRLGKRSRGRVRHVEQEGQKKPLFRKSPSTRWLRTDCFILMKKEAGTSSLVKRLKHEVSARSDCLNRQGCCAKVYLTTSLFPKAHPPL